MWIAIEITESKASGYADAYELDLANVGEGEQHERS
jgi:hypothetical protein